MTIKEFLLSLPRPWRDIKEYIDSRIQYSKILLSRSLLLILNESIDNLNKTKQDKLKAGENITIKNGVISAKGGETYEAGQNIDILNSVISAKGYTYREDINSFAEGTETTASGVNSHTEGSGTTASGAHSHAEGTSTEASNNCSHVEGTGSTASGVNSHAEGDSTQASSNCSHTEGYSTKVGYNYGYNDRTPKGGGDYGENGHAEGDACVAEGYASHAEGCHTFTQGSDGNAFQHAEGYETNAYGAASHTEGYGTSASGNYSHAEGEITMANGSTSHAEGTWTRAEGERSHSEGYYTQANGKYSHAEGHATVAFVEASHAEGKFNKTNYITPDGFIDLGLSSGTLWAKNNIGANPGSTAESYYGNYYAWGETQTKNYYAESNYTVTKYNNNDGKTKLDPEDDIATITYGSSYHMPTKTEIDELLRLPNKWVTDFNNISGLNGRIFAKTQSELDGPFNENTMLFFPANGYWYTRGVSETGITQYMWAANLNTSSKNQAISFVLDSSRTKSSNSYRYYGFSVRAVTQKIKHNATQHSVGIGTDENNRKNAFEIMQNGDIYVIGVGGYDGTNPNSSQTLQDKLNEIEGLVAALQKVGKL